MRVLLAVGLLGAACGSAYGLARRLLARDRQDVLTLALTTAGLSLGWITLLAFWGMVLRPGGRAFTWAFVGSLALAAATPWLARGVPRIGGASRVVSRALARDALVATLAVIVAMTSAGILFNAVFWPFEIGDALAIYARLGKEMAEAAALPAGDRLYDAYPMLVPILYACTQWAAGQPSEALARLLPALMAVGTLGATGRLAAEVAGPRAGWGGAALLALTPVFGRWASSGYTDIPAAFFVGLSALFAWRWSRDGSTRHAVLTGLMAGLAMWTKNSALTLGVSLAWIAAARLVARTEPAPGVRARRQAFTSIMWMAAAAMAVAAPWYVRNRLVFGFFVPPTIHTGEARHGFWTLASMLRSDQHFGASGWLFTAAVAYGLVRVVRRGPARAGAWNVLLAYCVPFVAAWWWLASYETRFLMTVSPILAAMAALMLQEGAARLTANAPRLARRAVPAAAIAALLLAPFAWRKTVEHKWLLLGVPWPDDAARHRVRIGGLFDLASALNGLPRGSRVAGVPRILEYHLDLARFGRIDWTPVRELPSALAPGYDYVVYVRPDPRLRDAAGAPLLATGDGYALYSTGGAR